MADRRSDGSLRRRLLWLVLTAVTLAWLAAAAAAYLQVRHEVDELLDGYLAQSAALLIAQAGDDFDEGEIEHAVRRHRYARGVVFQIWERGRTLRARSPGAPTERLSARDEGFSDVDLGGERWRVFSGWNRERKALVQVAERRRGRDHIVASVGRTLAAPLAIALPILGLLVWGAVSVGLRPLRALGSQVAERAPGNLAPLAVERAPAEVAPLVENLNRLFARVRESIEHERRFTADAAHELRTPIAALRAQAQVAQGATDDAQRARALGQVVAGCDRAAHLVDQMLTLARLEPRAAAGVEGRSDLRAIARQVAGELAPFAVGKGSEVEVDAAEPVEVRGDATLLAVLARNLVDNAVRYSPAGAKIRVGVRRAPGNAGTLEVVDSGPGMPPEDRARLGERFYRRVGSDEAGSGLGLSIVTRIAELHGATVAYAAGDGGLGLRVTVAFPALAEAGPRPATPGHREVGPRPTQPGAAASPPPPAASPPSSRSRSG